MHFLTALWELREGGHGATDEREEFESFLSIVNEYIRDNSPSEVNIDYKTKKSILQYAQRSAYMQLPLVRPHYNTSLHRHETYATSRSTINRYGSRGLCRNLRILNPTSTAPLTTRTSPAPRPALLCCSILVEQCAAYNSPCI